MFPIIVLQLCYTLYSVTKPLVDDTMFRAYICMLLDWFFLKQKALIIVTFNLTTHTILNFNV